MRRTTISALAVLLAAAACTAKSDETTTTTMAVDTSAAKHGIDSTRARYAQLQVAGDFSAVAGLFDETATLDVYGVPRQHGRAAIEAALKAEYGMRKFTVSEINPLETSVRTNDDASELGTYHDMYDAGGAKTHEWGRFIVGLRKGTDGTWRLTYLMAFPDSTKVDK